MDDLEKQLATFAHKQPTFGEGVYVARSAVLIGDVTLNDYANIWFNAVLRGDINRITVGHHSNIQDNCVLHLADEYPCVVGNYVTVGHAAIVHACTVGNEVLVGMGSRILDGAIIGDQSILGAGTLVTQGEHIPPGSLVLGMPGKVVRELRRDERAAIKGMAEKYVQLAAYYRQHGVSAVQPSAS